MTIDWILRREIVTLRRGLRRIDTILETLYPGRYRTALLERRKRWKKELEELDE